MSEECRCPFCGRKPSLLRRIARWDVVSIWFTRYLWFRRLHGGHWEYIGSVGWVPVNECWNLRSLKLGIMAPRLCEHWI